MPERVFVKINGRTHYLWRAVDHEGEVMESFVSKRRDRKAALKFLRKTMKRHGEANIFVTDKLRSCGAAMKVLGTAEKPETGRWLNNRGENSHQPPKADQVQLVAEIAASRCARTGFPILKRFAFVLNQKSPQELGVF